MRPAVELVRGVARIQAERIGDLKLTQPVTWEPAVSKAATQRVAA